MRTLLHKLRPSEARRVRGGAADREPSPYRGDAAQGQRRVKASAEWGAARPDVSATSRPGHDFGRIPVSSGAASAGAPSVGGRPLDPATRARMEAHFGHDFAHVRVHTDSAAAGAAAGWRARAFTLSHDIYFGAGHEASGPESDDVLAHELAHVVQAEAALTDPSRPPSPVTALEQEAQQVAAAFRLGAAPPPVRGVARGLSAPLRQPDDDDPGTPTFGNLPRDEPQPGARRLRLKQTNGKWYEIIPGREGSKRRASGWYDFVVQDGEIWAVKSRGPYGHTEAAQGGRGTYMGQIRFSGNNGQITEWNDGSGHYRPSKVFAANAGLPMDKFKPHPERSQSVQLPVIQPGTTPRGGGTARPTPPPVTKTTPPPPAATPQAPSAPKATTPVAPAAPVRTPAAGSAGVGSRPSAAARELGRELARNEASARRMAFTAQGIKYGLMAWSALDALETAAKAIHMAAATLAHGSPFYKEIQAADAIEAEAKEIQDYYFALDLVSNQMPSESDPHWNSQHLLTQLQNNYRLIDYHLGEALQSVKASKSNLDRQLKALDDGLNDRIFRAVLLPVTSLVYADLMLFVEAGKRIAPRLRNARDSYAAARRSIEHQRGMAQGAMKWLDARLRQIDAAGMLDWRLRQMGARPEDARAISEQLRSQPVERWLDR